MFLHVLRGMAEQFHHNAFNDLPFGASNYRGSLRGSNEPRDLATAPVDDHSIKCIASEHRLPPSAFAAANFEDLVVKIVTRTGGELGPDQRPVAAGTCKQCARDSRLGVPGELDWRTNLIAVGGQRSH